MKDRLCEAFCGDLNVRAVPAGLAVSTPFLAPDGDRIGFYIVKDKDLLRIEDDGLMLPTLEASGIDFRSGTRGAVTRGGRACDSTAAGGAWICGAGVASAAGGGGATTGASGAAGASLDRLG